MPAKITQVAPTFTGVEAGGTASVNLPLGLTYHGLVITLGCTLAAKASSTPKITEMITNMRLKMDGRVMFTQTGVQWDYTNRYYGVGGSGSQVATATAKTTTLGLWFDRLGMKTQIGEEVTAIGTGMPQNVDPNSPAFNPTPITSLTLEMDIASTVDARNLSSPSISATRIMSPPSPLGVLLKRRSFTYTTTSASGTYEISSLPKGDQINAIWIEDGSSTDGGGNITKVTIERDRFIAFERTPQQNITIHNDFSGRSEQPGIFVFDPVEGDNGNDTFSTRNVGDFRIKLDTGSSTFTPKLLVDYIGGLQGN